MKSPAIRSLSTSSDEEEDKIMTVEELVSTSGPGGVEAEAPTSIVPEAGVPVVAPRLRIKRDVAHDVDSNRARKRRSIQLCENSNAVSNRIQFWKKRESHGAEENNDLEKPVSVSEIGDGPISRYPKIERKSENLVNKLLKQTLAKQSPKRVEDVSHARSADDTIMMFDEIFASNNCPLGNDDNIEANFNSLFDEDVETEENVGDRAGEVEASGESGDGDVHVVNENEANKSDDENEGHMQEVNEEHSYVNKIIYSIEKAVKAEADESIGNISDATNQSSLESPADRGEGKYKCDDCGKDFKYLTYLKGHKTSKEGCINSVEKRKRPTMNFSKIQY